MNVQRRRVDEEPVPLRVDRRRWLQTAIVTIAGAIAATLATIVGGAVSSGRDDREAEEWLPAARVDDLVPGVPTPVVLRAARTDGYYESIDRQLVFLVRNPAGDVRALSSTCTHLGCRVSYDAAAKVLKCPCHGGRYGTDGRVVSGPPPRPLEPLATRVVGAQVLVRL